MDLHTHRVRGGPPEVYFKELLACLVKDAYRDETVTADEAGEEEAGGARRRESGSNVHKVSSAVHTCNRCNVAGSRSNVLEVSCNRCNRCHRGNVLMVSRELVNAGTPGTYGTIVTTHSTVRPHVGE